MALKLGATVETAVPPKEVVKSVATQGSNDNQSGSDLDDWPWPGPKQKAASVASIERRNSLGRRRVSTSELPETEIANGKVLGASAVSNITADAVDISVKGLMSPFSARRF